MRHIGGKVTPAARSFAAASRRVVRFAGQAADDAALAARVDIALSMHKGLDRSAIQVRSDDGVISLGGCVPSPDQRRLAFEVARGTRGVARVENHLRVASGR